MSPGGIGLQFAVVAAGGAAGAMLRHALNLLFVHRGWYGLPAATLAVNVLGCFLAGMLLLWIDTRLSAQLVLRNLLLVGFVGALTTFSAVGLELWQLLRADRIGLALATVAAHVVLGVLAVWAGWRLAQLALERV